MGIAKNNPFWVLNALAAAIAVIVGVSLPLVYFGLGYRYLAGEIEMQVEMNSRIVNEVVQVNPELWKYETVRLTELMRRSPAKGYKEERRIFDSGNNVVAENQELLKKPVLRRSETLRDGGVVVGRVEIARSLRPLLVRTLSFALFSIMAGIAVFVIVRILPLRALRKAIDALSEEKERAQVTLHSIGDGVITADLNGGIETINAVAEILTGWTSKDACGKPLEKVFRSADTATGKPSRSILQKSRRLLAPEEAPGAPDRNVMISRNGAAHLVEHVISPINDKDGRYSGAVLVFRDVTEKARTEEEMVKSQKLESLGILAGGIAHDFNNYLAGILGNISLAKLYIDSGNKAYERVESAEKASVRAKELATKLLTFSRGGSPVRKPVSVEEVLRDSAYFAVLGSNVRCDFSLEEGLWPAMADAVQIGQVINNLVVNAVQAMNDRGTVTISAGNAPVLQGEIPYVKEGNYVKVDVSDRGVGIPMEIRNKIFDPFFTTKEKGTGLGLTTAYNVMKSHGGNIFVDSEPGAGTTFHLYLPAALAGTRVAAEGTAGGKTIRGKGKVLVMDDEELILDVAGGMLEHLGYEPVFAKDGAEAISMYLQEADAGGRFEAVIMDLNIPGGMGGKEAAERLLKLYPNAKIIVSSGYSNDPVLSKHEEFGFQGVVAKPYHIQEFSRVLHDVILKAEESRVRKAGSP